LPALFKQRLVTFPTLWGWLLITLVLTIALSYTFKHLAHFLAKNQPVQGQYLIVEGWVNEKALLQAKALFEQGQYDLLITSGGPDTNQIKPDYPSYADKAAAFLISQGFDANKLYAAPAPASAQNRTYLSAVKVRQWFESHNLKPGSFDILSSGVHARRTYKLYQMAFNDSNKIGIIALEPDRHSLENWWQSSDGIKSVLAEVVGLAYTYCCFDPGEIGSHQELWGLY
jgi:hypothetical protein